MNASTKPGIRAPNYAKSMRILRDIERRKYLYLLLFPGLLYFVIFNYVPMYGIVIAFKDFNFSKGIIGSDWIGLKNFEYMFSLSDFYQVLWNSISLSFFRIAFGFPFPFILALALNEIRGERHKRICQTVIYLPHFISWVVLGGILVNFLSPTWGVVNNAIRSLGGEPIFFLARKDLFTPIVILSSIWKEAGWGTIIYLAAMAGIDPQLYEAAAIDGASRFKRLIHVTIPSIKSTIIVLLVLRLGAVMSNGFEQLFVLQNPNNLLVSEVFETYTYRIGILEGRLAFGTAVGVFTSVVGMLFLLASDRIAKLIGEEGIW